MEKSPPVTQADIARALGIADSTVSRALKNNPKIPIEHREKIRQAAERMGYRLNPMAAALAQWRQNAGHARIHASLAWLNISPGKGWLLRNPREVQSCRLGAQATAEKLGYNVEEFVVSEKLPLSRLQHILETRGITGILIPPHAQPADWVDFDWSKFSVVRFETSANSPPVHVVTSDQMANTQLALQKMRERGCDRIGIVTDQWAIRNGSPLPAGALLEEGARKGRIPTLVLDEATTASLPVLSSWLRKHAPDAIFTDVPTIRHLLQELGSRVPEDLALATWNVLDGNADAGIDPNPREIGSVGVRTLISLINSHERGIPPIPHKILIAGRWSDGETLPPRETRTLQ
jgi:LacI family transcriptional regulator